MASLSGDGPQIAGENYTLTCQVTEGGIALPTYQWFKNSSQIPGETSETLFFSPLNERLHNGVYSCLGTRSAISGNVIITVTSKFEYPHAH